MMCPQLDNYVDCARRQQIFCETILQRPELAKLVREISWTLSFSKRPYPPLSQIESDNVPSDSTLLKLDNAIDLKPRTVWATFSLLGEVKSLELRMQYDWKPRGSLSPANVAPPILFPKAQAVGLNGPITKELAATILSHNTSRIKVLDIDHLLVDSYELQTYLGWSYHVQEALPSLTSLTYRKKGAFSPQEPFNAAEEQEAFAELAAALEIARESIQQ